MRKQIVNSFVCSLVIAGLAACSQQSLESVATPAEGATVVKPAPEPVKDKPAPKPQKVVKPVKPAKPAAPVRQETPQPPAAPVPALPAPEIPVEPAAPQGTGQAEVTVTPAPQPAAQPTRLQPLGKRVSRVPMNGKYVALTFDDGPHAELTPKALDILKRHGARGTFFVLGQNAARARSIVRRAAAEGHEVGVHTWSHIKMNSSARAKVDREISRTQNLIAEITGTVPRVMRPPYGATNKALVNHMYNQYGMASILWDVDTVDWRKPGVGKVIATAVNKARPGSIILVHDIHATTLSALEGIVTGLQARGFKLVTVSELMQIAKREAAGEMETPVAPAEPTPVEAPVAEPPAQEAPALETVVEPAPETPEPQPATVETSVQTPEDITLH